MKNKYRSFSSLLAALLIVGAPASHAETVVTAGPGATYSGINTTGGVPTSQTTTTTTSAVPGALTVPTAVQPGTQTVPSRGPDLQHYANMVGQQGARGNDTQEQQRPQVKYYYKATDPNDPLATLEMPERLFNNIPAPNY